MRGPSSNRSYLISANPLAMAMSVVEIAEANIIKKVIDTALANEIKEEADNAELVTAE